MIANENKFQPACIGHRTTFNDKQTYTVLSGQTLLSRSKQHLSR